MGTGLNTREEAKHPNWKDCGSCDSFESAVTSRPLISSYSTGLSPTSKEGSPLWPELKYSLASALPLQKKGSQILGNSHLRSDVTSLEEIGFSIWC